MFNSEPKTDLPLTNMPRMGRRNAVSYPSRILSDDDGAFSPMNLLQRASISDIDPDGMIAQELLLERRSRSKHEQRSNGTVAAAAHVPSVLDGWKKLHDAKNSTFNGIERLFEPTRPLKSSLSVMETKPRKKASTSNYIETDENIAGNSRGNPVIPWRKQDVKPTTIAEERRKLFESFDMTSFEPPDTPEVSELTLRKLAKKNKRRKKDGKEFNSRESVASSLPSKLKDNSKFPYSNIQPKVNTRWDKMDELQQGMKLKSENPPHHAEKDTKTKRPPLITEKPALFSRAKTGSGKHLSPFPVKKQDSKIDTKTKKLVTNYPASETVKNTTDKLPLTIAPRYNHKKALGLTNESRAGKQQRSEEGENEIASLRLFGTIPAHQQRTQHFPKPPVGNSLKSTFFNLQRINNGVTAAANDTTAASANNKSTSSTGQLIVGRYSANILGTPVIGQAKKAAPIVTTIQPPPSPFLASKISIQSQMNEIPINGEKIGPGTSKGTKNPPKTGKVQGHKTAANSTKNKTATELAKNAQSPAKVVPTLGPVPNKYNNIYIGPYSGSDSEGEHQNSKKKR